MKIEIYVRDINGKRECLCFDNEEEFSSTDFYNYDDDNYEILMVVQGGHCIYSALNNDRIYFEDLIGYFA